MSLDGDALVVQARVTGEKRLGEIRMTAAIGRAAAHRLDELRAAANFTGTSFA